MMRNLVKNQWCAAHNGTITMKDVKAMNQKQLVEEYEYICRRLEKDRLLSAQYNLFRPKPAITEPPSKRQRVERASSQPASVPAATPHTADDPDSAGGGSSNPAGSATPMAGFAASNTAGGTFDATGIDSTVTTTAAMDSAGSRREIGVSPFADSAASSSPSNVSIDHIPVDVLFESTSGGILEFFLDSDEEERIGMSRIVADPDSDDEVFAEIIFRGKSISGDGVVFVDKLPDDEIVDPRVKVETVTESTASPPRSRRKHLGVRSDDFLWDKPVEDFFSSESESDDDMENYIPPLPYGAFKDWEIVSCPLSNNYYHVYYQENRRQKSFNYLKQLLPHVYREDLLLLRRRMNRYFRLNPEVDVGLELWRDVNMLCQSLHSDDVEDFWRTQDEWIVSSWQLYPKSSVHVLDLTNGKTVYMFVDKVYPIRATLLERMLRHRLTVPPSYCRDVVVAGNIIQTVQAGLRQAYECLASAPIQDRVWLPLQTVCCVTQNRDSVGFAKNPMAFHTLCCNKEWLVQVIRTFLNHLRHVLMIDVAHLKGLYKGTNLVAMAMDGNNQIVPNAFGICKWETGPCWSWWMSVLKECIGDNPNLLFISDRHAAIALAVENEFPLAFHVAYTREDFATSMNILQIVQPDAYKKLCEAGPQRWSRAQCPLVRYNYMTTNSVDFVNVCSVIYRKEPVLKLAETYRAMVQQWYYQRRQLAANITYEITDWAAHKVAKKSVKNAKWVVKGVSEYQYQVSDGQYIREVNLQTCICECRKWHLSGLPCGHVISVTRFLGLTDFVQYVSDWFKKPKYQGTYSESIHFLRNMQQWEFPQNIQKAIPPRMDNPQPGRPKNKKRIQSQGEEPRVIYCSRCTQAGHRRDQCNKPFVVEQPVNIHTQNDQEILRTNKPSFYNPNQQYDNTFHTFNQYTSQHYDDTTYPSQQYSETPYSSQPYNQHFTNTS
ncbi:transposase, MuDR, MULE transposase domain protein [Tanacetum coccineum]|uniref:Transposase, MuDR, MULE transposase domain protein n=1 Tax=Tanacetum coccineum TaxID=301880 RepID=A0ABQ5GVB1_9ASTR